MRNGAHDAVDIIIPVRNRYARTRSLLEGVYRYSDLPFHLYVIDNGSTDGTVDLAKIYTRDITVLRNGHDAGWATAVRQGIELGHNPWVVLMKNGSQVAQGWLGNLVSFLDSHPRIGAVGPLGSNPRDWQHVDRIRRDLVPEIPQFVTNDLHERNRILAHHFHAAGILVDGLLGTFCLALKRRALHKLGQFEARSDEELCRSLRKAGYVLGLSLDTYVSHPATPNGKAGR